MSDRKFRNKVIRLAHSNPELRADLLPLLQQERKISASSLVTAGFWNIQSIVELVVDEDPPHNTIGKPEKMADWYIKKLTKIVDRGTKNPKRLRGMDSVIFDVYEEVIEDHSLEKIKKTIRVAVMSDEFQEIMNEPLDDY